MAHSNDLERLRRQGRALAGRDKQDIIQRAMRETGARSLEELRRDLERKRELIEQGAIAGEAQREKIKAQIRALGLQGPLRDPRQEAMEAAQAAAEARKAGGKGGAGRVGARVSGGGRGLRVVRAGKRGGRGGRVFRLVGGRLVEASVARAPSLAPARPLRGSGALAGRGQGGAAPNGRGSGRAGARGPGRGPSKGLTRLERLGLRKGKSLKQSLEEGLARARRGRGGERGPSRAGVAALARGAGASRLPGPSGPASLVHRQVLPGAGGEPRVLKRARAVERAFAREVFETPGQAFEAGKKGFVETGRFVEKAFEPGSRPGRSSLLTLAAAGAAGVVGGGFAALEKVVEKPAHAVFWGAGALGLSLRERRPVLSRREVERRARVPSIIPFAGKALRTGFELGVAGAAEMAGAVRPEAARAFREARLRELAGTPAVSLQSPSEAARSFAGTAALGLFPSASSTASRLGVRAGAGAAERVARAVGRRTAKAVVRSDLFEGPGRGEVRGRVQVEAEALGEKAVRRAGVKGFVGERAARSEALEAEKALRRGLGGLGGGAGGPRRAGAELLVSVERPREPRVRGPLVREPRDLGGKGGKPSPVLRGERREFFVRAGAAEAVASGERLVSRKGVAGEELVFREAVARSAPVKRFRENALEALSRGLGEPSVLRVARGVGEAPASRAGAVGDVSVRARRLEALEPAVLLRPGKRGRGLVAFKRPRGQARAREKGVAVFEGELVGAAGLGAEPVPFFEAVKSRVVRFPEKRGGGGGVGLRVAGGGRGRAKPLGEALAPEKPVSESVGGRSVAQKSSEKAVAVEEKASLEKGARPGVVGQAVAASKEGQALFREVVAEAVAKGALKYRGLASRGLGLFFSARATRLAPASLSLALASALERARQGLRGGGVGGRAAEQRVVPGQRVVTGRTGPGLRPTPFFRGVVDYKVGEAVEVFPRKKEGSKQKPPPKTSTKEQALEEPLTSTLTGLAPFLPPETAPRRAPPFKSPVLGVPPLELGSPGSGTGQGASPGREAFKPFILRSSPLRKFFRSESDILVTTRSGARRLQRVSAELVSRFGGLVSLPTAEELRALSLAPKKRNRGRRKKRKGRRGALA